jgi:hypothetical protein
VFEQHRRFFAAEDVDPCQALLDNLREAILSWQATGDIIVLGMDANEDTRSGKLRQFFSDLHVKNAILDMHKDLSPPATHARNTKREPIDGIWVSKGIDPIASGFLALGTACPSDHMALWVDFRKADLFGEKTPSIVFNINKLKADDPWMVQKYNDQSKKELRTHAVKQRLTIPWRLSQGTSGTSTMWKSLMTSNESTSTYGNESRITSKKFASATLRGHLSSNGFMTKSN